MTATRQQQQAVSPLFLQMESYQAFRYHYLFQIVLFCFTRQLTPYSLRNLLI